MLRLLWRCQRHHPRPTKSLLNRAHCWRQPNTKLLCLLPTIQHPLPTPTCLDSHNHDSIIVAEEVPRCQRSTEPSPAAWGRLAAGVLRCEVAVGVHILRSRLRLRILKTGMAVCEIIIITHTTLLTHPSILRSVQYHSTVSCNHECISSVL